MGYFNIRCDKLSNQMLHFIIVLIIIIVAIYLLKNKDKTNQFMVV